MESVYNEILVAGRYYIDLGMPVIPLCPATEREHNRTSPRHKQLCKCSGKIPLIANWVSRNETTEENFQEWIEQFKTFNIGLPMGEASGYVGIDIDGEEGEKLLLQMSGGDIPETWEFKTGAGRRLLYSIPVGFPTKKAKMTGEGKHQECAILCTGQQTAIPPSVHHTGSIYRWVAGKSPSESDCAMAPKWLLDAVKADKPKPMLGLNRTKVVESEKYVVDMKNLASEFEIEEFSNFLPTNLTDLQVVEVKTQSKQVTIDPESIEGQLYQVIGEGNRDNTITQIIGHFLSKREFRAMPKEMFLMMMLQYNANYCDPPLDDASIEAKVNHFYELEAMKSAGYKELQTTKEWIVTDVVRMIRNKLEEDGYIIKYDQDKQSFYFCNKNRGPWKEDRDGVIEGKIWTYMVSPGTGDSSWGSQYRLKEAMDALELELRAEGKSKREMFDMNKHHEALSKYIVVDGRLLDWKTGELLPWNPEYNATTCFNVKYDPKADCPHWKSYMEEWLPDPETRQILQEFMGSALLPEPSPEEKFIILSGGGSNGKSMFLKGMQNIFKEYSVSLTPQKLAERFGPASLYGKLLNVCSEIEGDGGYLKNTSQIKAIVSGEQLTAENKGKDAFQFNPVANIIFSCNTIPKSKDTTYGWYRRQVIVPFKRSFKANSSKKREMEANMLNELPGIFNWLIEGLRNIKKRGYFIISEEVKTQQQDFKALNENVIKFLQECTRPMTEADRINYSAKKRPIKRIGVSTTRLYSLYTLWYKYTKGGSIGSPKNSSNFMEDVRKQGYEKGKGQCIITRSDKQQCFYGLMIDVQEEELCEFLIDELQLSDDTNAVDMKIYMDKIMQRLQSTTEGIDDEEIETN